MALSDADVQKQVKMPFPPSFKKKKIQFRGFIQADERKNPQPHGYYSCCVVDCAIAPVTSGMTLRQPRCANGNTASNQPRPSLTVDSFTPPSVYLTVLFERKCMVERPFFEPCCAGYGCYVDTPSPPFPPPPPTYLQPGEIT